MVIDEMTPDMADAVLRIYAQGVRSGLATFTTQAPSWEEWSAYQELPAETSSPAKQ